MGTQDDAEPQAGRLRIEGERWGRSRRRDACVPEGDCKDSLFYDILPYTEDYYAYGDKHSKVIPVSIVILDPQA